MYLFMRTIILVIGTRLLSMIQPSLRILVSSAAGLQTPNIDIISKRETTLPSSMKSNIASAEKVANWKSFLGAEAPD